jgi:hypothetical protein
MLLQLGGWTRGMQLTVKKQLVKELYTEAQNCRALLNAVMTPRVPKKGREFLD